MHLVEDQVRILHPRRLVVRGRDVDRIAPARRVEELPQALEEVGTDLVGHPEREHGDIGCRERALVEDQTRRPESLGRSIQTADLLEDLVVAAMHTARGGNQAGLEIAPFVDMEKELPRERPRLDEPLQRRELGRTEL